MEWNRYRHYTYKDCPEKEKAYIRTVSQLEAKSADAHKQKEEKQLPAIYSEFEFVSSGEH